MGSLQLTAAYRISDCHIGHESLGRCGEAMNRLMEENDLFWHDRRRSSTTTCTNAVTCHACASEDSQFDLPN